MTYYSKSPSELRNRFPQKSQGGGISKKGLSRIILFGDLILVFLVALYFRSDVNKKEKESLNIEKKIEFSNLKISSSCKKTIGCHISIQSLQKKPIYIKRISWQVTSSKQKENQLVHTVSNPKKRLKQNDSYENTFVSPFNESQIIYVELSIKQQAGAIKFQAFP